MTDELAPPPPRKPGRPAKAYSLKTLMELREEMVRVYREMRGDRIAIGTGFSLIQVLAVIAKVTEVTQGHGLIERLEKLEVVSRVPLAERSADSETN